MTVQLAHPHVDGSPLLIGDEVRTRLGHVGRISCIVGDGRVRLDPQPEDAPQYYMPSALSRVPMEGA